MFSAMHLITRMATAALTIGLLLAPTVTGAKGLFSPVAHVNDSAITNYELQQRILLLEALRTAGDLRKEAMKRLINERLQLQAATLAGIHPTRQEVADGVDEFAERVELSGKEFLNKIAQDGVDADSFRDFVRVGIAWRQFVRDNFAPKTNITDADIDRAIQMAGTTGSARVLISEIFLPTNTPKNEAITLELAPQIAKLRTVAEFADAATRFSAGPSRERGGRVEKWVPLSDLPANIRPMLLTMKPGQVTEPVEIPNALALFQLRALQETQAPRAKNLTLDYAAYYIDGGRSPAGLQRAAEVREQVDTCDGLYKVAKNQPPEVLERDALPLKDIPHDVALELAKLDEGEVSTALTRANGETLVFLMLCARIRDGGAEPSRDEVRLSLTNKRLSDLADTYLDELRANSNIRFP